MMGLVLIILKLNLSYRCRRSVDFDVAFEDVLAFRPLFCEPRRGDRDRDLFVPSSSLVALVKLVSNSLFGVQRLSSSVVLMVKAFVEG